MKKILIVANWKMNPLTLNQAKLLYGSINKKNNKKIEVIICPPFIYIQSLNSNGAQNCFGENLSSSLGAFTGEISCLMLKELKVKYVIIGHSERRKYFYENQQITIKKIQSALNAGLIPILCVDKISQIPKEFKELIVAYEPISAIGTGQAYGPEKAKKIRQKIKLDNVLYGGSVNSENALDYLKKAGFQGLLIGKASLKAQEFNKIIKKAESNE